MPGVGHTPGLVRATIPERDSGTDQEILHGPGCQQLALSSEAGDARGDPPYVVTAQLAFAGMNPSTDRKIERRLDRA